MASADFGGIAFGLPFLIFDVFRLDPGEIDPDLCGFVPVDQWIASLFPFVLLGF
jgi:hypothetical protein